MAFKLSLSSLFSSITRLIRPQSHAQDKDKQDVNPYERLSLETQEAFNARNIEKLKKLAAINFDMFLGSVSSQEKFANLIKIHISLFGSNDFDLRQYLNTYFENKGDINQQSAFLMTYMINNTPEDPHDDYLVPWFCGQILRQDKNYEAVKRFHSLPDQTHPSTLRLQ